MARFGSRAVGCAAGRLVAVAACTVSCAGAALAADQAANVDAFRAELGKWVETRQILSAEKADWEVERETLLASKKLLQQEKEALTAEIAELEETSTVADEERRDLLLARGEFQRGTSTLESELRGLEEQVLAIAPELPEPLQKKLEPLLVQIPENPENTRLPLGQRLMNVLGVLAQAEKFNGTATFVAETRPVGDQKLQVRTLYWGLAQAYYVDAQGRTAGVGRPATSGWEFSNEPDLAGHARRLLDIYEGNVDAIEFVELPVEIR